MTSTIARLPLWSTAVAALRTATASPGSTSLRAALPRSTSCVCNAQSSAYSTTTTRSSRLHSRLTPSAHSTSQSPLALQRQQTLLPRHLLRFSSTTAAAHDAPSPAPPTSGSPSTSNEPLTWNRFLALRKTRRRISLASSVVFALTTTATGLGVLAASFESEAFTGAMLGLEPPVAMGLISIGCGLVGWLIGPFFGNWAFRMYHRGLGRGIAQKEKEFYQRIKKNRVDPSSSSVQNPVPDFYGEKIGSVAGYRRWLKDQRAFNLKRGRVL